MIHEQIGVNLNKGIEAPSRRLGDQTLGLAGA
jgi:hypothetical protein